MPEDLGERQLTCIRLSVRDGSWADALVASTQWVTAAPDHAEAWYWHGVVLRGHHLLDSAAMAARRSLELRPDWPDALRLQAYIRLDLGNGAGALEDANRALAIDIDNPANWVLLAASSLAVGAFDKADAQARSVLDTVDDTDACAGEAASVLGRALWSRGRHCEAEQVYRRALATRPDDPELLRGLGHAVDSLGRSDEAVVFFSRALEVEPGGDVRHELGRAMDRDRRRPDVLALSVGVGAFVLAAIVTGTIWWLLGSVAAGVGLLIEQSRWAQRYTDAELDALYQAVAHPEERIRRDVRRQTWVAVVFLVVMAILSVAVAMKGRERQPGDPACPRGEAVVIGIDGQAIGCR